MEGLNLKTIVQILRVCVCKGLTVEVSAGDQSAVQQSSQLDKEMNCNNGVLVAQNFMMDASLSLAAR